MRSVRLLVAAGATAILLPLAGCSASHGAKASGPAATHHSMPARVQPAPPAPLDLVARPAGDRPVDFGDLRLWVPRAWQILDPGVNGCPAKAGAVLLGTGRIDRDWCHDAAREPVVRATAAPGTPAERRGRVMRANGYRIIPVGDRVYDVPALHARIQLSGDVPTSILRHIGPTPWAAVLDPGPTAPIPAGWTQFSLGGVHLEVPSTWPRVAALNMDVCSGSLFPASDKVYVGAPSGATATMGCPAPEGPSYDQAMNAIWVQRRLLDPSPHRIVATSPGTRVSVSDSDQARAAPYLDVSFHGVSIVIGTADPATARVIFRSIGYSPSAKNSPVAGACPTQIHDGRPAATEVTHKMVLSAGEVILEPPAAGSHPRMSGARAWRQAAANIKTPGDTYHLLLSRYSPHGEKVPGTNAQAEQPSPPGELAWVVYGVPTTTVAGPCAIYSLEIYNAGSGRSLLDAGYFPGP